MNKKKIFFATGSRADYGIVRNYLKKLNNNKNIVLSILATGALLSPSFGHQVELIYKDGFKIEAEIDINIDPTSNEGVIHSMSIALDCFGKLFSKNRPDLLIILGDRYEILSVAVAGAMNRIPILHLHGGEATFGNYDEFIRHSITKMSLFHFTATEEFKNRVIQLGEAPERVFNLGSLGAENCLSINENDVPDKIKLLKDEKYFVILFHPETLTNISVEQQICELLDAVNEYSTYKFVFLGSNADTNSNIIREKVRNYVEDNNNCLYFENLPTSDYHYLLKNSVCLIGNSSSGLIEAPSLGVYTINIGDRQEGRVKGNSVFDVKCLKKEIKTAIDKVISIGNDKKIINPYFKEKATQNYYETTLEILKKLDQGLYDHPKKFYDIEKI